MIESLWNVDGTFFFYTPYRIQGIRGIPEKELAGVLLLMTGALGLAAAFGLGYAFRSQEWSERWWVKLLLGLGGVVIGFGAILIYARISG